MFLSMDGWTKRGGERKRRYRKGGGGGKVGDERERRGVGVPELSPLNRGAAGTYWGSPALCSSRVSSIPFPLSPPDRPCLTDGWIVSRE